MCEIVVEQPKHRFIEGLGRLDVTTLIIRCLSDRSIRTLLCVSNPWRVLQLFLWGAMIKS